MLVCVILLIGASGYCLEAKVYVFFFCVVLPICVHWGNV